MDMLTPTCLLVQREGELYQIAMLCAQVPLGIEEAVVHVHLDGRTCRTPLSVGAEGLIGEVEVPCIQSAQMLTLCIHTPEGGELLKQTMMWEPPCRREVCFVPVTHHDLGYTQAIEPLMESYCRYYDDVLRFCEQTDDYPEEARYHYTVESLWSLEYYLRHAPAERLRTFFRYVEEGRIEISALYANVIDGLCSAEELIRLLYPAFALKRQYGCSIQSASLVDIPGAGWGLIKVLGQAGIPYLFAGFPKYFEWPAGDGKCPDMAHTFWDEKELFSHGHPAAFQWQAQDGSEVYTWYQSGYGWFGDDAHACIETDSYETVRTYLGGFLSELDRKGTPYSVMRYIDHGSDNQPPKGVISDIVRRWNQEFVSPKLCVCTNRMFFEKLQAECPHPPALTGDLPHTDYATLSLSASAETGLNARTHARVRLAETISAMANLLTGETVEPRAFDDVYRDMLLYDEHCFGMGIPCGADNEYDWSSKQHYARRAAARTERMLSDAMQNTVGRLALEPGRYVTVFNSTLSADMSILRLDDQPLPASGWLVEPDTQARYPFQTGELEQPSLPVVQASERYGLARAGGVQPGIGRETFCAVWGLPPVGYKTLRVEEAPQAETKEESGVDSLVLENRYYRLQLDGDTGTVTSLFDKELQRELVDRAAPHGFNGVLFRYTEAGTVSGQRAESVVRRLHGPVVDSLLITAASEGCPRIWQEIRLYHTCKRVDFSHRLLLDSTPLRELFVAYPFLMREPRFTFQGAGSVVRPFKDQLAGSNTNQYAVQNWVRVEDDGGDVVLSALESPVMAFGGLHVTEVSQAHHGVTPKDFEKPFVGPKDLSDGYVYSMLAYNNCRTNFAVCQQGEALFQYSVTSGKQTDPEAFADAFVYPPVGVYFEAENKGELPPCWSGLALDCPNVRLQCLKKAEDGRGYILRLYETSGKAGVATLRFAGLLPQRVVLTTLVEEDKETLPMNGASLSCAIDAWGILTLRLLESN